MRQELIDYGKAWEKFGYEVRLWTEANLPPLRNRTIYERVGERIVNVGAGVPALGKWVQRADIASYELIFRYGGIYANCDIEPLRDVHLLLDGIDAFAGWEQQFSVVCNALMGCTAEHPFFDAVIRELPLRYERMPFASMNETTGPHLITDVYRTTPGLRVFDERTFYPYNFLEMNREHDTHPDSFAAHHWGHTRGDC